MKQMLFSIVMGLCILMISPVVGQEAKFVEDYLERLENSQKYLALVAETMPNEAYDFKPTPESLSFAEHLMHIGYALDWHSESLLGGRESRDWNTDTLFKVGTKSKQEMMATIKTTFEKAIRLLEEFDTSQLDEELDYFGLNRSKRQIFLLLADHVTHHRSQMLVYMRLKGHTPPRYVLFQ